MSKLLKGYLDPKISRVQEFYDQGGEWDRKDRHPVEFAVTERILGEYLPSPPARLLDMGGGPGRYAFHLQQKGYAVTLADLSSANIAFAQAKSQELKVSLENYLVHDATQPIPFEQNTFDAVLLMGPLYHLTTHELRLTAVQNALDVLKPGGVLFAAFITMFGALRSIVLGAPNQLPAEWRTMKDGLNDANLGFTEAYFARVNEIESLMEEAGCEFVEMIGCEGFSVIAEQSFVETQMDDDVWQQWVDLNLEFGRHRTAVEASDHILYVARKP